MLEFTLKTSRANTSLPPSRALLAHSWELCTCSSSQHWKAARSWRKTRTKQLLSGNKKGKERSHFIFVLMESVTGCLMSFLSKDLLLSRSCPKTHAVFSRPLSLSFLDKQKAAGIWNLFQESRVQICVSPSPGLGFWTEFENVKTTKQQHDS